MCDLDTVRGWTDGLIIVENGKPNDGASSLGNDNSWVRTILAIFSYPNSERCFSRYHEAFKPENPRVFLLFRFDLAQSSSTSEFFTTSTTNHSTTRLLLSVSTNHTSGALISILLPSRTSLSLTRSTVSAATSLLSTPISGWTQPNPKFIFISTCRFQRF